MEPIDIVITIDPPKKADDIVITVEDPKIEITVDAPTVEKAQPKAEPKQKAPKKEYKKQPRKEPKFTREQHIAFNNFKIK